MLKNTVALLTPYILELNPYWAAASVIAAIVTGVAMKVRRKEKIPAVCFTVLYLCLVYTSTVLSRAPGTAAGVALSPFWSYRRWLDGNILFLQYIVLNILMLLPIGISLCALWESRKRIVCFGFGFSCFIEISQLLTGRGLFDIDDIMHNTIGVMLGILIYSAAQRLRHACFRPQG